MPPKRRKYQSSYSRDNLKKRSGLKKNWIKITNKIIGFLIIFLGIGYIVSVNDLSIKGFVLDDLHKKQIDLEENNKELELNVMALESFETVDKKAQALKMVKVDKIDYITISNEDLAKK